MELDKIFKNLNNRDGIYYNQFSNLISYPEEGNDVCFQVEDKSYWFQHRNECISSLAKRYAKYRDFWDIGGGNGIVTKRLQEEGFDAILVEPGEKGVINAKKRNVKHIICSNFEELETSGPFMNNVGLFDVIEHIEDDVSLLGNICIKMEKNGLIFLTVPAYNTLWSNEDVLAGHFRRYNQSTIKKLLTKTGFDPVYSSYLFAVLPIPIFIFRTLTSLISKSKNKPNASVNEDHQSSGIFGKILNYSLNKELNTIKRSKRIGFGSSCLVVAVKK